LPPELRCAFILPLPSRSATAVEGLSSGSTTGAGLPAAALEGRELLQRFSGMSDGRSEQGRDHPVAVAVVLTLCAAAVLAGMRSFTAITGWVARDHWMGG
jgi:hypothetical protein